MSTLKRLGLALLLPTLLTACVDARVEVDLTSTATARIGVSQQVSGDTLAMMRLHAAKEPAVRAFEDFCRRGTWTVRPDRSVTCARELAGTFRRLTGSTSAPRVTFSRLGSGLVRVSISTAALQTEIGDLLPSGGEMETMVQALLHGRTLTLRIAGGEIVWSNMDVERDRSAAQKRVPLRALVDADPELPEEFYAVVRVE